MTSHVWTVFPLTSKPPTPSAVPGVLTLSDGTRCIELPENGWGALLAWAAGPQHVTRLSDSGEKPPVVTSTSHADGTTTRKTSPRTVADQAEIDEAIDEYLSEAALPPRPRGWRWFLALPPQHTTAESFQRSLGAALRVLPKDADLASTRAVLEQALPRDYET